MNELKEEKPTLAEIQAMPVHPIAAMFPMITDDELAELATDIAENGVNHPIVITRDGVLIDGRNRLAACAIAKVEPPIAYFEGDDPAAFIISENVNRRHLSKSQRAMAVAKAFPNPATYKRGAKSLATKELASEATLSQARTVIRLAPDLVDQVLAGSLTVDLAYKQASLRKSESERRLDRIRAIGRSNPEFAESVSNGALTIDEAEAKIKEAEKEHKQLRWAATKNLVDAVIQTAKGGTPTTGISIEYNQAANSALNQGQNGSVLAPSSRVKSGTTYRSSQTSQHADSFPHGHGGRVANALGQGAKLLAGLGGAHESTEYDAARAPAPERRAS